MAGGAQMSHWRKREQIRSLYVTEISFPWHFGDLQSHFPVFLPFISAQCHAASTCPIVFGECWAGEMEAWLLRGLGNTGLTAEEGSQQAVLFCVLYRQQDWGHHTDYCDVKWKQNFPSHREAGIQLAGALGWSQIINACILNVFFAFPKLRIASSLPRSQRSSVYETPIEKVSVGSFLSTKILPIFPHDPGCLPAAYSCCFL